MKTQLTRALGWLVALAVLAGTGSATTITFSGGSNADIPLDYGSNIAGDAAGFVTSDGTGATPNIGLTWAPSPNVWEFHNSSTFADNGFEVAVGQIDVNGGEPDPTILFETDSDFTFLLHSLDIGNAVDQSEPAYSWTISLLRASDDAIVFTYTTSLLDATPFVESVPIDYTGDPGEDYTLLFDDGGADTVRSAIDNLSFSQVVNPGAAAFELVVDRDSGGLTLQNVGTGAGSLLGYSIRSDSGALEQTGWLSIAENYAADSPGPDQIDPDNNWTVLTNPASRTDLSESELEGGNGATIGAAASVDLGASAWLRSPTEDVQMDLLLPSGELQAVSVRFEGNGGTAFEVGDMDFNGVINTSDWPIYNAGRGVDLSDLSTAEAYRMGDLDGDGDNDIVDFLAFKEIFDLANGPGSFAAIGAVPEPTSAILLIVGTLFLSVAGRYRLKTRVSGAIGSLVVVFLLAAVASATTITFSGTSNADIPLDYGSNIIGDAAGFVTTDGTGATPSIGLTWAPSPNVWEFHNSDTFADNGFEVAVGQMDVDGGVPDPTILFAAPPNVTLLFHSLDIGNAVDQIEAAYSWTISLVRTSDDATVFSHTTALLDASPFVETVPIDYTGDPGEDYMLLFDDGGANTVRSAIDNLSFSEVAPSPLSLTVNRDTGEVFLGNRSGITVGIDSYEITSVSNSLDPVGWSSLEDQDFEGNGAPGTGNGWEEAGGIGTYQLIESYLQGGSTFADGVSISLGSAFDVGAEEDLDFSYHVTGGPAILTSGEVDYVNGVVLLGDVNLDKVVNGLDVDPFVDVLLNGPFQDEADMNIDGEVNGLDVDPFVAAVVGGGLQAVPEPSTLALLVLALVGAGVLAYSRP